MTTTTSDATQIVLDLVARMNSGDIPGAGALLAENCLNHAAIPEAQGRSGFERIAAKLRTAFPDLKLKVEDVVAAGDRVVVRGTVTGTHRGPLMFVHAPLEATGKSFTVEQIHIYRVVDGRIVESWAGRDDIGMFRQLGLKIMPA